MKLTKILLPILTTASLLNAQITGFDNAYFFGDSLTDNGNLVQVSPSSLIAGQPVFSDGPTWAANLAPDAKNVVGDVLNPLTGFTPSPTFTPGDQSINFSFGGARSEGTFLNPPPTGYQINTFFSNLAPVLSLDSNDVGFIWTGHNDLTQAASVLNSSTLASLASGDASALARLSTGVQTAFGATLGATGNAAQAVAASYTQALTEGASSSAATAFSSTLAGGGSTADAGTAALIATANEVSALTVGSVNGLRAAGLEKVVVLGVANIGSTPAVNNPDLNSIVSIANNATLSALGTSSDLLYIDTAFAVDEIIASPEAFGITSGALTDSTGVFFIDGFHPSGQTQAALATYIQKHFELAAQAPAMGLHFDLLRGFDEQQSFRFDGLEEGGVRAGVSAFGYQSSTTGLERNMTGARVDLDYAFSEHLGIGIDFIAGTGEAGNADYDGYGVSIEKILHFDLENGIGLEVGGNLGFAKGTLDRDFNLGTFETSAETWTLSGDVFANVRKSIEVGNRSVDLIVGVNHNIVQFDDVTESPDSSLALRYGDETVNTTTAVVELAYRITDNAKISLLARPVLYSGDVDFQATQAKGLASYGIGDISGYDVHTYGATFTQGFEVIGTDAALFGSVLLGSDDTMYGNIGVNVSF